MVLTLFAVGSSNLQMEDGGLNRRRKALIRVLAPAF